MATLDQEANNRPNGEQILQKIRKIEVKIEDSKVKHVGAIVRYIRVLFS